MSRTRVELKPDESTQKVAVWDESQSPPKIVDRDDEGDDDSAAMMQKAREGHLFFINTWFHHRPGELLEVFVDEPVAPDVLERTRTVNRQYLLSLPTGKMLVGAAKNLIAVPPGDYVLRCHVGDSSSVQIELEKRVGEADMHFYEHAGDMGSWGCLSVFLLFLAIPFGWKVAILVTASSAVFFFAIGAIAEFIRRRDERYKRVDSVLTEILKETPLAVFELRRIESKEGLTGGWVDL